MEGTNAGTRSSLLRLILVPSLITLGVTLLRLTGELQGWSRTFFNPDPGGPGSIVGIVWLPVIFGPYFAMKLSREGQEATRPGLAVVYSLLGLLVMAGGATLEVAAGFKSLPLSILGLVVLAAAAALQFRFWPALAKALLAYAYAARIPVAILMFFAIGGNWHTHYDAPPPNLPAMGFWGKYFAIALLPQLIFWVVFTVIVGMIFGTVITAILGRRVPATRAA